MHAITIKMMLDAMDFVLDNTYTIVDGRLHKQVQGIPMGDSLSPPLAIGTCAWMEVEWLKTIPIEAQKHFRLKRYLDDILWIHNQNCDQDMERLLEDFESHG